MPDIRVVPDQRAIRALPETAAVGGAVLNAANSLVPGARARAPKDTGAGAFSIHAEQFLEPGEWTARVSWDREHDYMRFHELGTVSLPAQPFLEE
jgi:HK97 gp10 family phage protein